MKMLTFAKQVSPLELEIYQVAARNGLSPEIVAIERKEDKIYLTTKAYTDLSTIFHDVEDLHQMISLVNDLHSLSIYHADIKEDNFVYDVEKEKLYIIDFGRSKFFHQMNEDDIKNNLYSEFYNEFEFKDPTLEDLIELEKKEVNVLLNI